MNGYLQQKPASISFIKVNLLPFSIIDKTNSTDNDSDMNKCVNFEDSLFILAMRIRLVRDVLTLDASPELFLQKTADDIMFTDHIFTVLLTYLEENYQLIERAELLQQIADLEWQFSQLLQSFLLHDGNLSVKTFPELQGKIAACRANSLERLSVAERLRPAESGNERSSIVSSDELIELLKMA